MIHIHPENRFKRLMVFTSVQLFLTSLAFHTTSARSSIPRSNHHNNPSNGPPSNLSSNPTDMGIPRLPPWNVSPNIDPNGFFTDTYSRIPGEWEQQDLEQDTSGRQRQRQEDAATHTHAVEPQDPPTTTISPVGVSTLKSLEEPVIIRQVPGDGNCLFHSLTVALAVMQNRTHLDLAHTGLSSSSTSSSTSSSGSSSSSGSNGSVSGTTRGTSCHLGLAHLYAHSTRLRQEAVGVLSQKRRLLFLQGNEYLKARDLVQAAAAQYGLSGSEYCELMKKDSYWGGGPEIVVSFGSIIKITLLCVCVGHFLI